MTDANTKKVPKDPRIDKAITWAVGAVVMGILSLGTAKLSSLTTSIESLRGEVVTLQKTVAVSQSTGDQIRATLAELKSTDRENRQRIRALETRRCDHWSSSWSKKGKKR